MPRVQKQAFFLHDNNGKAYRLSYRQLFVGPVCLEVGDRHAKIVLTMGHWPLTVMLYHDRSK